MPPTNDRKRFAATLCKALNGAGYIHVRKSFHRGVWSNPDVESFVAITYGKGGLRAHPWYGIRNIASERFAFASLRTYGDPSFYGTLKEPKGSAQIHGELSLFTKKYGYAFHSYASSFGENAYRFAVSEIIEDVERFATPYTSSIVTLNSLLNILVLDREPFEFFRGNPALRVAAICSVAKQIGCTRSEASSLALPFQSRLRNLYLMVSPDGYLDAILGDPYGERPAFVC